MTPELAEACTTVWERVQFVSPFLVLVLAVAVWRVFRWWSDSVEKWGRTIEIAQEHQDILGELTLYTNWRWLTKQLTTEQKEMWATAKEDWQRRLHADDSDTLATLFPADRWWLCPTCEVSIAAKVEDGPHQHCMYTDVRSEVLDA